MCITTFYVYSNPPLNTVKLVVSEFLMLHKNTFLRPFGNSSDISPGNHDPTEPITLDWFQTELYKRVLIHPVFHTGQLEL